MSIEQDQEKLINASAQIAQNTINTAAHLASLRRPQTKVKIETAKDQVKQTQSLIKQGSCEAKIRDSIANSAIAKRISQAGNNSQKYVDSIVKKARINNAMENSQQQSIVPTKKIGKTR